MIHKKSWWSTHKIVVEGGFTWRQGRFFGAQKKSKRIWVLNLANLKIRTNESRFITLPHPLTIEMTPITVVRGDTLKPAKRDLNWGKLS